MPVTESSTRILGGEIGPVQPKAKVESVLSSRFRPVPRRFCGASRAPAKCNCGSQY